MKNEMNLTEGNLYKKLWIFVIPLIFAGLLQLLYTACDLIVCGQFGSEHSVAAISATNALINLIINLFMGLSVGANVLMARAYGADDKQKSERIVYTAMSFSIIIGIVVGIFGASLSHIFLAWMKTPADVIDLSSQYLFIYFLGLPFLMIYNFGAAILRAIGDTKRPFIFLSISGLINVLLNLFLVIVLHLDVGGVAIATISSQAVSATLVFISIIKNKSFFEFDFKNFKIYKKEAIEIIKIGLPTGLQSVIMSISNVLIQSSVNSLGTAVLDGNGASASLESFIWMAMNQSCHACIAFVSANYGAKKIQNIKKCILYSLSIILIVWFVSSGIILMFDDQLILLYLKDDFYGLEYAKKRLTIIATTYYLCGIMDLFAYSLRGLGYSAIPAIVSLIGTCFFRIFWIYTIFVQEQFNNIEWLALSYPISWLITASVLLVLLIIFYRVVKNKMNLYLKDITNN
ncbi:MAG: MATE family efflux transporter [Anaeroplasma sp.]|nr:MATE family efflux transporter [Anaeroplasma sp.]